jgi:His/Glu/Gln/Arg/opine family amino acid ABC transporter permease subunit
MSWLEPYVPELIDATIVSINLAVLTTAIASPIGVLLAIASLTAPTPARLAIAWFSWVMRAVPLLIILFFAYYALPSAGVAINAFEAALIGFSMSSAAYFLEVFRGAFAAIPVGQSDAARALGLSSRRFWRRIALPQAMVAALPPYITIVSLIVKGSAVAGIITVNELTSVSVAIIALTFRPFELLGLAAVIYLVMSGGVTALQFGLERVWAQR